ncbi:uncharacterized protein LOC118430202 [Branchiostoma floridae]|uniref:Uncharacterized protein LOC118430202 n=1 Tax=Branchiostoma floridae TaxID=7739 RepID=C3XQ22_BRAFL|nr:uncharacterized protein LOC118430202 [Branchiostoma floridae]|eukprot:XP_002614034.1 hypothetical protein BRAFLDRAFT_67382 [Branchiostoma floridae]
MEKTKAPSFVQPNLTDCHPSPSLVHLFRRHRILQSPMYLVRWIYALVYSLYLMLFVRAPNDSDVVEYIETTTLAMLIRPASNGRSDEYDITVNDCKLRATGDYELKSLSLRYKNGKNGAQILHFTRNGVEVGDMSQIFSTFYFYHIYSFHPKIHSFSNGVVRYIVDHDVKTLLESTYTSIPLHYSLLHSSVSPLQWEGAVSTRLGYGGSCIRESVVEESKNMDDLKLHQATFRWNAHGEDTFVFKLFRMKQALQDVMERHGIDQNLLEGLFNHTILHSLDHHQSSQQLRLRFALHPWETGCTTYQAFNTSVFRVLMTGPTLNPLAPNTLRSINKPFYQDLYRELKKVDPNLVDVVTASVMY